MKNIWSTCLNKRKVAQLHQSIIKRRQHLGTYCFVILFFPNNRDTIQSNPMTVEVGLQAAIVFREEFQEKSKAILKYCSAIRGAKIMQKVSMEEKHAGLAISASDIVSERLHGTSTDLLQVFGTINIPHAATMGQSRTNNNHDRSHKNLVTG